MGPIVWLPSVNYTNKTPKEVLREELPYYINPFKLSETYKGTYSPDAWDYLDLTDLVPVGKVGALGAKIAAPAAAMVLNPRTFEKFIDLWKTNKEALKSKSLNEIGSKLSEEVAKNEHVLNMAAFLQTRYPRLFNKLSRISNLVGRPSNHLGKYVINDKKIRVNLSAFDEAGRARDEAINESIAGTLGHEFKHHHQYTRETPSVTILEESWEPARKGNSFAYLIHPAEIEARVAGNRLRWQQELFKEILSNPELIEMYNKHPEEFLQNLLIINRYSPVIAENIDNLASFTLFNALKKKLAKNYGKKAYKRVTSPIIMDEFIPEMNRMLGNYPYDMTKWEIQSAVDRLLNKLVIRNNQLLGE